MASSRPIGWTLLRRLYNRLWDNSSFAPHNNHMPEQRGQYEHDDNRGREDQRRKRGRSPHSQDLGRDDSRQKQTRTPLPRPMSLHAHMDTAAVFSRVLPEWEIEEMMHIPIHMTKCQDCTLFAEHMQRQTQGGALEILNDKQRRHWRQVLKNEFKKDRDEDRKAELREHEQETEELNDELEKLKDKLRRCHDHTDDLEDKNKSLRREVWRLREELRRVNEPRYSSVSRGGARTSYMSHDKEIHVHQDNDPSHVAHRLLRRPPA
jgi:archaellum component FlaC